MSDLESFARAALKGLMARPNSKMTLREMTEEAYRIAEMVKERKEECQNAVQ